jgi:ParB family chromosome partitioning protein
LSPFKPSTALGNPAPTTSTPSGPGVRYLALDQIEPNRFQPRTHFDPEHLRELAASIKQQGVIQPLLVRPLTRAGQPGVPALAKFELIAGERRLRAAREAGLTTIPVIVRQATDLEALEVALIENLQRDDLDPIEESRAYQQLATQFTLTQDQIADRVGRSRAAVANSLRLLGLPEEVQSWVADDRLSVGHAKAILGLSTAEEQRLVAERVLKRNLTVRETEELVEQLKGAGKTRLATSGKAKGKTAHIMALEEQLRQKLGTHVSIRHGRKKGRLEIEYYGNDDLQRLLGILGVSEL